MMKMIDKMFRKSVEGTQTDSKESSSVRRGITPMRIGAVLTFLVALLMISTCFAGSGIVKAETEKVKSSGDMTAQLRPEFSDVSYVIDDTVIFNERFDNQTDYEDRWTGDQVVSNSSVHLNSESISVDSSADYPLNHSDSGNLYLEMRLQVESGTQTNVTLTDGSTNEVTFSIDDETDNAYELDTTSGSESVVTGNWTRIGIIMDADANNLTAKFMYDNYTAIETIYGASDWTVDTSEFDTLTIKEDSGAGDTRIYYTYVSQEGSPLTTVTDPGKDTNTSAWKPDKEESQRAEVNYEDYSYASKSGENATMSALGAKTSEFRSTKDVGLFNGNDSREFLFQTPEKDDEKYEDKANYYQGWENVKSTIEGNIRSHIADYHGVDESRVTLIDYYLEDLRTATEYESEAEEGIKEAYADALLQKAEKDNWELKTENMDGDDWKTVEELLMRDDFTKMEIQGHTRYGHPKMLQEWKDYYTVETTNLEMMVGGSALSTGTSMENQEFKWWNPFTSDEYSAVKTDIEDGAFQVNLDTNMGDVTDDFADIGQDMKEMSIANWGAHKATVSDLNERWGRTFNDMTGAWEDMTIAQAESFQATNSRLASVLEGTTDDMANALSFSQEGTQELATSLTEMQKQFTDQYASMTENMFKFMTIDESGVMNGKPTTSPLSLSTATPTITITTIVVIVVIVVFLIGAGIMWRSQTSGTTEYDKKTKRR